MGVPGERMTEESYATLSRNQLPVNLKPKGGSAGGVLVLERGFLVLTRIPNLILGESFSTSIKDFAISPPHKKNPKNCERNYAQFVCKGS